MRRTPSPSCWLITWIVFSLSLPLAQQRTPDLDFMTMEQRPEDSGSDSGTSTHTAISGPRVVSPLRVQLLTIEPQHSCTVGDLITFDVAVRNET